MQSKNPEIISRLACFAYQAFRNRSVPGLMSVLSFPQKTKNCILFEKKTKLNN